MEAPPPPSPAPLPSGDTRPLAATVPEERGIPGLGAARRKTRVNRLFMFGALALALGLMGMGGAMFVHRLDDQRAQAKVDAVNKKQDVRVETRPIDFRKDKQELLAQELPVPADALPASQASAPITVSVPQVASTSATSTTSAAIEADSPRLRRWRSGVMVETDTRADAPGALPSTLLGATTDLATASESTSLENALKPSRLADGSATRRPDLSLLLRRGTLIPCGLKTRIVTTYPGMTSCVVSKDVYSADGSVLLVEKGSELLGEQRSALTQGQARIFVIWNQLETRSGVSVQLNSPGTDALGASGHEAWVDTHWWQRFGSALLLSVIDDAFATLAEHAKGDQGSQISYSNTTRAANDMASKALESTLNIPPTAYKNHGDAISIFVARDIDFRSVYERLRRP